jgi:hypothetical protein
METYLDGIKLFKMSREVRAGLGCINAPHHRFPAGLGGYNPPYDIHLHKDIDLPRAYLPQLFAETYSLAHLASVTLRE